MAPVRVVRAFRLPITAIMTALALSGCMRTTGPVAVAQPQSDLDSMAYGQTYAPAPVAVADSGGGGAVRALRPALASSPPGFYPAVPPPAGYSAPVRPLPLPSPHHLHARGPPPLRGFRHESPPHP